MKDPFPSLLINWYQQNARSLPWRGHLDPYAIWVSEIMLQQTRIETVIRYVETFMTTFPTITTLADSDLEKEKEYIRRDDNGQLAITVIGADKVEQDGLVLGKDLLLPESTEKNQKVKLIEENPEGQSELIPGH